MRVTPAASRIEIRREPGGVRVIVRVRRNPFAMLFLAAWLGGWAIGEVSVVRILLGGDASGAPSLFLVLWLVGWTAGGNFAAAALAYGLVGREEIALGGRSLSVRSAAGPLGRTREYDLASVSNVRAEPPGGADLATAFRVPRAGGARGAIAFDHGAATVRVGPGLEGEDVTRLLEVLRERIPGRRAGF